MFFSFFRNRRRRRWLAQPVPEAWLAWLHGNVWQYRYLSPELQSKVQRFVCILYHEKQWDGGGGLEVTDEMRVTVAGQAALATLGFLKPYYFERLQTIILYAGAYSGQAASSDDLLLGELGSAGHDADARSGESWQGGPIILSWDAVIREGRDPQQCHNVVLHEFAHHMDGLDGVTDGVPPLTDSQLEEKWYRVTEAEYERLCELTRRGQPTLLNQYGATDQAEFFAVSTECFFTHPHAMAARHEQLYGILTRLFGQDPREWLPEIHPAVRG